MRSFSHQGFFKYSLIIPLVSDFKPEVIISFLQALIYLINKKAVLSIIFHEQPLTIQCGPESPDARKLVGDLQFNGLPVGFDLP